jgi:hypothetical protein
MNLVTFCCEVPLKSDMDVLHNALRAYIHMSLKEYLINCQNKLFHNCNLIILFQYYPDARMTPRCHYYKTFFFVLDVVDKYGRVLVPDEIIHSNRPTNVRTS